MDFQSEFYLKIGIDQSLTSTGVVILTGDKMMYKIFSTSKNHDEKMDTMFRCRKIADDILALIDGVKELYPMHEVSINIEGLAFGNVKGNATRDLAGLQMLILDRLNNAGYEDIEIITPTSLKKFATGKGNANKDLMFESLPEVIKKTFSALPKTKGRFDATDAFWLAKFPRENNDAI